jgi:uncharacterized heparinase superfamily protein
MQAMAYLSRRRAARLACERAEPCALVWQPAPPTVGDPVRARLLARGVLLFDGRLVETNAALPWEMSPPDAVWSDHLHGHGWLDHAAAAGDPRLWVHFEAWLWAWIERYGDGSGPGWRADLVARRLTRWIGHAIRLLRGTTPERSRAFFKALSSHARYLGWRWRETAGGARIEALGGLVYAALAVENMAGRAPGAIRSLGREADRLVLADGGVASRNPEELARILAVLSWSAATIEEAGLKPAAGHLAAMRRAAPVVRALTTPAGTPARFHGGRAGEQRLTPLAAAEAAAPDGGVMGYLRLDGGTATAIVDAAPPAAGRHDGRHDGRRGAAAHASALGFELWLGRQPVIVSCGSGLGFGAGAAAAGRRAEAHSTVRMEPAVAAAARPRLFSRGGVTARLARESGTVSAALESRMDVAGLGLVLNRHIALAHDGTWFSGVDVAHAATMAMRKRAHAAFRGAEPALAARFHIHPEVRAALALNGRAVALTLPGGARWLMQVEADGLALEPSVYYDETRATPRATVQVVARSSLVAYRGRIVWSLEPMDLGAPRAVPEAVPEAEAAAIRA